MKALLDTCIIVDALQSREPYRKDAENILIGAANKSFEGFITAKSVADIYYLTHRATHSDKETRTIISKLFAILGLLDTSSMDCQRALFSEISDYEDAIMEETALRYGVDCIVTRNIKDYHKSSIDVLSPEKFVAQLLQKKI